MLKRILTVAMGYFLTGIGMYYIFSGNVNFYSIVLLAVGIIGILFDIFYKKLKTE